MLASPQPRQLRPAVTCARAGRAAAAPLNTSATPWCQPGINDLIRFHRPHSIAACAQRRRRQRRRPTPTAASAAAAAAMPLPAPAQQQHRDAADIVYVVACTASFMAAISRMAFSVLAVPIQQQFGFSPPQMGLLQSALLLGYVIGQVPSGMLSDWAGGARVLVVGLLLWSLAGAAMAFAPSVPSPLAFMLAARGALGLAQAGLMPGLSAAAAQWFPVDQRGSRVSSIYACYSVGTVMGLASTPALAAAVGWPAAFGVLGGIGAACAAVAWQAVPQHRGAAAMAGTDAAAAGQGGSSGSSSRELHLTRAGVGQLALLCWTHGIIGFGFFVLQGWIPTYLYSLGMTNLRAVGAASALPWLATAGVAVASGRLGDWLQVHRGWTALRVRRVMQVGANLGALALAPLALAPPGLSPAVAVTCLTAAVAAQGLNYAGYHAYVQDVAPEDAGLVLGVTNTCSALAGVAGNMLTGQLMAAAGMGAVFGATAGLYVLSAATWLLGARGAPVRLTRSGQKA